MLKILVIIPAGEVYDHDCVRWYRAKDVQKWINHYHNIGDAFVHDSSLKLLSYDHIDVLDIRFFDEKAIDRYNNEYDFCFLRGSNYIHSAMEWLYAAEILERLTIPVIAFGIGAQAAGNGWPELSSQTERVLRVISERCASIGVRGTFTADVLARLGIRNVRVIGCPTLFRHRWPDLRIELPPLAEVRKVAFTLRREVSATYAQDITHYLTLQRESILSLASRFDLTICSQGEIEEKKLVLGTAEQKAEALGRLEAEGWLLPANDPLRELYQTHLFYADIVTEYDRLVRRQDFVLGYRLHGNLIALANGVPSVYFVYDTRTAEFVETFEIPAFNVFSDEPFVLEEFWEQARFEKFNRAYRRGYGEIRTFLEENGVSHRLSALPVQSKTAAAV